VTKFQKGLLVAFFLCLGAATAEVILQAAEPELDDSCKLSNRLDAQLEDEIRFCKTEMCAVYFMEKADVAKEECLVDVVDDKLKNLPKTEKY
jgi:hypothetical protein